MNARVNPALVLSASIWVLAVPVNAQASTNETSRQLAVPSARPAPGSPQFMPRTALSAVEQAQHQLSALLTRPTPASPQYLPGTALSAAMEAQPQVAAVLASPTPASPQAVPGTAPSSAAASLAAGSAPTGSPASVAIALSPAPQAAPSTASSPIPQPSASTVPQAFPSPASSPGPQAVPAPAPSGPAPLPGSSEAPSSHAHFHRPGTDADADSFAGSLASDVFVLKGNVVLHSDPKVDRAVGDLSQSAEPLTVTADEIDIDRDGLNYVAKGNVHFTQGTRSGKADLAMLDEAAHTIDLIGNANVVEGDHRATAAKMHYNMLDKDFRGSGDVRIYEPVPTPNPNASSTPAPKKRRHRLPL